MVYDALVIGGGPAGATTALMLARAGWAVVVVEKNGFPRRKVCGEFISATSLPLLRELGVEESFLAAAGPEVRRVGLFAKETVLVSIMPEVAGARARWGRALGREHLDLLLLEAAVRAGAKLWQPWKATELRRGRESFVCKITARDSIEELVARVAIRANGSWERGLLPMEGTKMHKPSDLLAFKARFLGCKLPADLMPLLVFPGGYGGMVHSDGGRVSLSCCICRATLERCRQQKPKQRAAEAVLRHIEESCLGVRQALIGSSPDGAWLSAGPIQPGIRKPYSEGIFQVGNIAGEAHPIIAEGISMAMQSAWLLCRHLIARRRSALAGRALDKIGQDYGAEWNSSFAGRIRAASVFAHIATRPNLVTLLLPLVKAFPQILTLGAQLSGKSKRLVAAGPENGRRASNFNKC